MPTTRQSSGPGDLVFTEDPETIGRQKKQPKEKIAQIKLPRVDATTTPSGIVVIPPTQDLDEPEELNNTGSTIGENKYMDASNVFETEAEKDAELNPSDTQSGNETDTESISTIQGEDDTRTKGNPRPIDLNRFIPPRMPQELPSGEWYMPDLDNTPLSDIMKIGNFFDRAGRLMHQFPKIAKYTGYDTYVIHPHTGGIEIVDLDRNITLPFEVQAFRKPQDNKTS